jgi:small subunit ribosomal protein S16
VSLKIRLKRAGSKKRPFYRVVVTDSRRARDSRSLEDIGYYNPLEDPVVVNVDRDKVAHWTSQGALPSETVRSLLLRENSTHASRREIPDFTAEAPRPKPVTDGGDKGRGKGRGKPSAAPAPAATAVAEAPPEPAAVVEAPAAPVAEVASDEAPTQPVEAPAETEGSEPKPEGSEPKPEA